MKKIAIFYPTTSFYQEYAIKLEHLLFQNNYEVSLHPISTKEDFNTHFEFIETTLPNALLTLGLVGMERRFISGDPYYTKLPLNIIHDVRDCLSVNESLVTGNHPFSTTFLVKDSLQKEQIRTLNPCIYDIQIITDFESDILFLLTSLDYRNP